MDAKKNWNNAYLEVYSRGAGDFGYFSMSGVKYEDSRHLEEMEEQIKRHVNRVGSVNILFDGCEWICGKCGDEFETKEEAENCHCK